MNGLKKLGLSATVIATALLGVNIPLSPDATLMGAVVLPAQAQDNDDDQGNARDDDDSLNRVRKAHCAVHDNAETGLQGQIPLPDRLAGFKGFNCNLEKTASTSATRGDGLWQQFAYVRDSAGRLCGYAGGTYFSGNPGTVVVDLTDPDHSVQTALLTTPGMITPGEGLRAHTGRGLLVSGNYQNAPQTNSVSHGFDVYDVGTDCRHPQLLSSTTSMLFDTTGLPQYPGNGPWPNPDATYGHEGAFAPDGRTYYESDPAHGVYHAIDVTDPTNPKLLGTFQSPAFSRSSPLAAQGVPHGVSISDDGKRTYFINSAINFAAPGGMVPQTGEWHNGFLIVDTSDIQARRLNPKMRVISEVSFHDGSAEQMTIPIRIKGKHYLVVEGEAGTGQLNPAGIKSACAAGLTPFAMVKIFDIQDERKPKLVNNLVLEVNDPVNCATIAPEASLVNGFIYDVHMCSVDNRDDATTLVCGYFQSGIRVYDIRNPKNVKEIAYFVPPAKSAGPGTTLFGGSGPGWCAAIPFLDAAAGMLYSSCADSGVVSLKFTNDVWPFPKSKTPHDRQL
jgi:hypothetical protein